MNIEIISNVFFNQDGVKLETNTRRKLVNSQMYGDYTECS